MSAASAMHGIFVRDLSRAFRQKSRLIGGLARPFMWLLLVGTGFNPIARVEGGASYQVFYLPRPRRQGDVLRRETDGHLHRVRP